MKNIIKSLFVIILTLGLFSCDKIDCPAYDFEHPINKWNFFPKNELQYNFLNSNSDTIHLIRTKFEFNNAVEKNCYYCACFSDLSSEYEFAELGLKLIIRLSYGLENNKELNSLYFGFSKIGSPFNLLENTIEEAESQTEIKEFNLKFYNDFTLINKTLNNVTELAVIDKSKSTIHKIWISPNQGIIGLEINNVIWEKE